MTITKAETPEEQAGKTARAAYPPWRKKIYNVVMHKYFEYAVFILIAINCSTIAAVNFDSTVGLEAKFDIVNNILTFAFAIEMGMKFLAHGPVGFFKQPWNVFDLVVVVAGIGGFIAENDHSASVDSPFTRTIRILRLVRILSVSEKLRVLVTALVSSAHNLLHVILLLSFFILLVSDIALDFFKGSFQHRCYPIEYALEVANGTRDPTVTNDEANDARVCRYSALSNEFSEVAHQFFMQDTSNDTERQILVDIAKTKILHDNNYEPRYDTYSLGLNFISESVSSLPFASVSVEDDAFMCQYGDICIIAQTPQFGRTNFDTVISTVSLLYDLMSSLDGWTFVIYFLSMGQGWWIATLYFGLILTVGNFFLLNLTLVVILDAFDRSQTLTSMIEEAVLQTASDMDLAQQLQDATNEAQFIAPKSAAENVEGDGTEGGENLIDNSTRRGGKRRQQEREQKGILSRMARALGGTDEFDANDNSDMVPLKNKTSKSRSKSQAPNDSNNTSMVNMAPQGSVVGDSIAHIPLQEEFDGDDTGSMASSSAPDADDAVARMAQQEADMVDNMNTVYQNRLKTMRTARHILVHGDNPSPQPEQTPEPADDDNDQQDGRQTEVSFSRPSVIGAYSLFDDYADAQQRTKKSKRTSKLKAKSAIMCCIPCWNHIPCPRFVQRAAVVGLVTRRVVRQSIVATTWFRVLTGLVIVVNLAFESTLYAGMSQDHRDAIDGANVFFTVFYVIEILLKVIAYPFFVFRRDFFNFFDILVTGASTAELFITEGGATFSALRSLRLLRIISLIESFRSTMATLVAAFRGAISLLALLFLFMFLYAVIGMQIFAGNYCGFDSTSQYRVNTTLCDNVPRWNFDNVGYSFQTIFSVVSSEGWRDMMVVAAATTSPYATIFFCVAHFTVGYLILNLFVAVMLSSCSEVQIVTYALSAMLEAERSTRGGKVKAFSVQKGDIGIDDDEEHFSKDDKRKILANLSQNLLSTPAGVEEDVMVAAVPGAKAFRPVAITSPVQGGTAGSPSLSPQMDPSDVAVDMNERRNLRKAQKVAQDLVTDMIAQQGLQRRSGVAARESEEAEFSEDNSDSSEEDETPKQKLDRHKAEELRKRNAQRDALVAEFANSEAERLIERGVATKHLPGLAHTKDEETNRKFQGLRRDQYPLFAQLRLKLREIAAIMYTSPFLLFSIASLTALSVVYQFIYSPLHGPYNTIREFGYGVDIAVAIIYILEVVVKMLYFGITNPERLPDSVRFSNSQQVERQQTKEKRKRAFAIRKQQELEKKRAAEEPSSAYSAPASPTSGDGSPEEVEQEEEIIPRLLGDIDELSDYVFPSSTFFEINWNIFELVIACTSVAIVLIRGAWNHSIDAQYRTSQYATVCHALIVWLRILRNLHVWSFIRYFPLANLLLRSLIRALQTLRNAIAITLLIWYIYSVLGLQLFGDKFNACTTSNNAQGGSDNDWGDATYNFPFIDNREDCEAAGHHWLPKRMNFNNVFEALVTTFNVATVSNWHFTMYTASDVRDRDLAPLQNSTVWAPLYFMSFIVIMAYFLINFFKSALIDSYFSTKAAIEAKFVEIREAREAAAELVKQRRKRALEAARRRLEKIKRKEERDGQVTARDKLSDKANSDDVDVSWDDGLVHSATDAGSLSASERARLRKNDTREVKKKHLLAKINAIVGQVVPTNFMADVANVENARSAAEIRRAVEAEKNSHDNFVLMLTEDERYFFNLYRFALYFVRPPLVVEYSGNSNNEIRKILRRWFRSRQCDTFIFLIAATHMLVEFTQYWDPPVMSYRNFAVTDLIFTILFILIMLGKMVVYGRKAYFDRRRNQLDVFINLITFIGCIIALSTPQSFMWTSARIMMFFRFLRLHYILFISRGMAVQLRMFGDSSKSFLSVFALLFMFVFTFTSIAMNLFGRVRWTDYDGLNQWSTFSRFDRAMFGLVRIGTTDNWNHIMHNCQVEYPLCDPNIGECGNKVISPIFFMFYLAFADWIGLNFFTAVLMEGFVKTDSDEKFPIQQDDVRQYQRQWKKLARRDPTHHTLTFNELVSFLCLLPPKPFGVGGPLKNLKGSPVGGEHDGIGASSPFSKLTIADALTKASKFLADTGVKNKYAQQFANIDSAINGTHDDDQKTHKPHHVSVTRLFLSMTQVPLYYYGKPSESSISIYGDGSTSTLSHYYCFPDDVFDGLARLHYGNKLPKVAEGLLLKERFSRFRREHAEEVMEGISGVSHFGGALDETQESLLTAADRVERGQLPRDNKITNNFAVTNVATMTAALVIQRYWRSLRNH